ncbi:MAG: hypothetical protein GX133_07575 [Syntrophomonadaceae bacterium]|nr:hypothetical protein [Syntrophomonadaceae bacterium]
MGISHVPHGQTHDELLIKAMTEELQTIRSRHQLVMARADELAGQIAVFEKRQEYARAALEESRRIAAEINDAARQRVAAVMKNVDNLIGPQQADIARLETEIAELKRKLASRGTGESRATAEQTVPSGLNRQGPGPYRSRDEQRHSSPSPLGRISGLEMRSEKDERGELERLADLAGADSKDEARAQAAAGEPKLEAERSFDEEYIAETETAMIDQGEIPATAEIGSEGDKPADTDLQAMTAREPSRPKMNMLPRSVVTSERTELSYGTSPAAPRELIEEREDSSIMHLDVFLDTRHFHFVDPWNKQDHRHRWQVKVQVEVPATEEIAYSQLLSAVNSTLLKYDNVSLNDVFPFDNIDPSHENIAGYFFNCLEDMVAAKSLRLVEVSLWEKQNLVQQVHGRNAEIDTLLRGEGDLEQIRDALFPETSASSESSFRKMLGAMFKTKP